MLKMSHFSHLLRIKSRIVRKPLRTLFLRHEEFPHFFLVWGLVTGKGRAALEKEMQNPTRKLVTLEFNQEDIIDVYASQFTDHPYKFMDMPCAEPQQCGGHQDVVLKDGVEIGWSSVPTYSSHYHVMISHCTMDIHGAEIGDEVIVKWGDFGGVQKDLRAIVRPSSYVRYKNDVQDNRNYDLSTVPNGNR